MKPGLDNTQQLLNLAREGNRNAFEALFTLHRDRLRRAISLRLNAQLAARVDTSDLLQETYMEAADRLQDYLKNRKMPFYLWLWWIARERIIAAHRFHLVADKRSVKREAVNLPLDASAQLVDSLLSHGPSPSQELRRAELAEGLKKVFETLEKNDREMIVLRHFEQLSAREISSLLKISEAAANKRYIRALERLKKRLGDIGISGSSCAEGRDAAFRIAGEIKGDEASRSNHPESPGERTE